MSLPELFLLHNLTGLRVFDFELLGEIVLGLKMSRDFEGDCRSGMIRADHPIGSPFLKRQVLANEKLVQFGSKYLTKTGILQDAEHIYEAVATPPRCQFRVRHCWVVIMKPKRTSKLQDMVKLDIGDIFAKMLSSQMRQLPRSKSFKNIAHVLPSSLVVGVKRYLKNKAGIILPAEIILE
ncbi:MAG: hypothetical protein HYW00_01775 [Candidatus Colwellbacteria bacterium]|nr:hypothetical protein [Candidatus Colwellbacteria bacterium]